MSILLTLLLAVLALPAHAQSVQEMLDEAVRSGKTRVELPAGVVRVEKGLSLRGANGLTIEGAKTTLLFGDRNTTGFRIGGCRNLTLRGFTVDYDPLPFVQGSITARADDGTWFDFEVHAGYPGLAAEDQAAYRQAYVFEAERHRWKRWVPDLYPRTVEIRDARHGRLVMRAAPAFHERIAVGDRVVLTLRTGTAIRMDDCENVRIEDVTLWAAPGCAVIGRYMRGENVFRYSVRPGAPPAGATQPRLISTCADAFNYAYATRGPVLDGCRFSFMGDDSVNLHGALLAVVRQKSPTEVLAAWPYSPEGLATVVPQGAMVRRLRAGNFEILGEAKLTAFAAEKERRPEDLEQIRKVWPRNPAERGTVWRLSLAAPLPCAPGDLLDIPANNSPGYTIRNCVFEDHRARGLRLMASHGLVEKNVIRRVKMVAISLGSEFGFWREAGWVEDVTVRNNRIEDVCHEAGAFSPQSYTLGAISVCARHDQGFKGAYWPGNRDIDIEGNTIAGSATAGIYVAAGRGVKIRNNHLSHVMYHPGESAGTDAGLDLRDPIDTRHGVDVETAGNTVAEAGVAPVDGP